MAGPSAKPKQDVQPKQRLDKWLVFARFFKTRDLAAEVIEAGHLRLNGQHCRKPGHGLTPGDVLTFAQGHRIRLIRVTDLGHRRGSAVDARLLYLDLDAAEPGNPD